MFEYQEEDIAWMKARPRCFNGNEPGLGKSREMLLTASGRTLVVAPAMILDAGTWDDEHQRWRPDLDLTQVAYSSITRRVRTQEDNPSATKPLPVLRPEYRECDTLLLDEAHYIKGRKTTWTQAIEKIRCSRLILATGTPIPNWAHELWVPLRMLRPDDCRSGGYLGSYWRWIESWFATTPNRHNSRARDIGNLRACTPACAEVDLPEVCEHWLEFYRQNLGDLFLQRLRDDVLTDLPPLTEQVVRCPLLPEQKRIYAALKRDFIAWTESGHEVLTWDASALHVKLDQVVSGVEVVAPGSKPCSSKLDQFQQRVAAQSQPSFAVAHYRNTVRAMADRVEAVGKSVAVVDGGTSAGGRRDAVQGFQSGRYDVLVGSMETVSEGITLTRADTVHLVERSWKPSRNTQVIRRAHRIGQTRPVTCLRYLTPGTIDSTKERMLQRKTDQQMRALRCAALLAALREDGAA